MTYLKTLAYIGAACTVAIICIALFALRYVDTTRDLLLDGSQSAQDTKFISNVNLMPESKSNNPLSWTLSMWVNVDDWDYRYNDDKYLIRWDNSEMWFVRESSTLRIAVPLHNGTIDTVDIENFDIQKWNHICIILENRYLDCWINGELVRSIHLANVPRVYTESSLSITPYGGYRGKIANVKVYNRPLKQKSYFYANTIDFLFKAGHTW